MTLKAGRVRCSEPSGTSPTAQPLFHRVASHHHTSLTPCCERHGLPSGWHSHPNSSTLWSDRIGKAPPTTAKQRRASRLTSVHARASVEIA